MAPDHPLHVRLVTWDDDPPVGGQGVYARELRRALGHQGVRVSTTAGTGAHAMAYRRLTGRGHLDMSVALSRHPGVLLEGNPDLVHLSGGPGGLALLRTLPVPVVFTAHHTYALSHRRTSPTRAFGLLESRSYRRAQAVAAVSPSTAESVVRMGIPRHRVVVISPGVDIDCQAPVAGVINGPERQPTRMLFVGRLRPEKGPLNAVAAMRRALDLVPGATGCVVGTGPLAADVAVAAAGDDRIEVLGRVSDEEMARQYRRASVVLMPSSYEGLGLVALEAMAQGAVVVGYDVVGLHDTIGRSGVLVPFGDVPGMAAAAARLLADTEGRAEVAADALDLVRRERSWEGTAASFDHLYREILSAA